MAVFGSGLGIADDQESLNARISNLESLLYRRQEANITQGLQARRVNRSRVGGDLPEITGLTLDDSLIGGIGVKWNAVPTPDLRYFEVQSSPGQIFANDNTIITRVTGGETSTVVPGDAGDTLYVRVRALSSRGAVGNFSPVLNTAVNVATVNTLAQAASAQRFELIAAASAWDDPGPFTIPNIATADPKIVTLEERLPINATAGSILFTYGSLDVSLWTDTKTVGVVIPDIRITSRLRKYRAATPDDIITVDTASHKVFNNTLTEEAAQTLIGFTSPDIIVQDDFWLYFMDIGISDFLAAASSTTAPQFELGILELEFFEYKG